MLRQLLAFFAQRKKLPVPFRVKTQKNCLFFAIIKFIRIERFAKLLRLYAADFGNMIAIATP
jgi:hypothetical protein